MNILLSYPRSGSTWLRYCVEFLTGFPTVGQNSDGTQGQSVFDRPMINKGRKDYVLTKRHSLYKKYDKKNDSLILLLRNYKECIPRHNYRNEISLDILRGSARGGKVNKKNRVDYVSNIQEWEKWNKNKWIVYYEDLINDPENTLAGLLLFLGFGNKLSKIKELIDNFEFHKNKSLSLYKNSHTQGNDVSYHVDKIKRPDIWDNYMEQFNLKVINRYKG